MLRTLAFLLFLTTSLFSQEKQASRTMAVRGLSFHINEKIPDLYAYSVAGEEEGVKLQFKNYLNHERENLQVVGTEFILTSSPNRASLKDSSKIIAKTTIPKTPSVILLLLPGSGQEGDPLCHLLAIDDAIKKFPAGSFLVSNLSNFPLKISLEKTLYEFKAGESRIIEEPPVGKRNSSAMRAVALMDGKWERVGSTAWPHPGPKRVIQVAYWNPRTKKIELKGIRDISPEPAPVAEQ